MYIFTLNTPIYNNYQSKLSVLHMSISRMCMVIIFGLSYTPTCLACIAVSRLRTLCPRRQAPCISLQICNNDNDAAPPTA